MAMSLEERKARKSAYMKIYYAAHREKPRAYSKAYYAAHREKMRAYMKTYHAAHREEQKVRCQHWMATHREYKLTYAKNQYAEHRCEILARAASLRTETRTETFAAYGNKCLCCGEQTQAFLVIRPVNAQVDNPIKKGTGSLYRWLKKNNFPPGFQTLCWNCNMAKSMLGTCPHQQAVIL